MRGATRTRHLAVRPLTVAMTLPNCAGVSLSTASSPSAEIVPFSMGGGGGACAPLAGVGAFGGGGGGVIGAVADLGFASPSKLPSASKSLAVSLTLWPGSRATSAGTICSCIGLGSADDLVPAALVGADKDFASFAPMQYISSAV